MSAMRKALPAAAAAVWLVVGSGAANAGVPGDMIAPESDVAHHGHVLLSGDRIELAVTSRNHGPSDLPDATVRLTLSVPPAGVPRLPPGCLRTGEREVLCATGPLRADGPGRRLHLELWTVGGPHEVVVRIGTAWNGGASDRNPYNNEHRVLAPATGDPYVF
ncbi:hypothetical protein ABZ070_24555 [Streptomyces sp. NPDC006283]|uniref:hypothetical protein n=1 Tax=Streptomyces sp. NPDC006283 TaxID=3156741 RepID=UPI0033BE079C